ncbi:ABC transporter, permease protein [Fusobacterium necrophorum subsp. funduliforme ATCC 51357]|uniref:Spermidine/putrescine ABC transporter permease n=3 Tax=Fusobacterium necrophorum TaxID=859 RepID=A0A162JEK2_9FUSO|nr:ABC transporter permease [Fusobacterium necrophorum]AYV93176.1 ABC transporter permease [Fusobacterium necrophorum subsp. funduliforme]AYZ74675.1 ABC transporter permease [Fusobacterium necrophorum]AZW09439.1 ABC transporter permease [Fusobacterium necrophorum subsp. necrophorum]EIJ68297.1 ABC transporter, permease protein [Fusobacterium necrophorum subsp. funduliforme ATCC 51357]EYD70069.1 spermidine/putrescine ABC transporter permease [Fusobacterium necrophorum subsp. funduliforme B35]
MNKRRTSFFFFCITMLFFYLPLLVLVVYSFNDGKSMVWKGFSLRWYRELFTYSENIWQAFRYSIGVAVVSGLLSTVIGTLGAIALKWYSFKSKKYLQLLTVLPLVVPDIIIGVSLLIMFASIHWKLGLLTIFIAHTTFNIPYVLFIVMARLEEFDYSVVEAAYDLGATERQAFQKVILPMLFPAIISGFLMAVTLSFDDFVITFFVAGPGSSTLPLRIYSMIRLGVSPVINALSVILIALSIVLTISTKKLQKNVIS